MQNNIENSSQKSIQNNKPNSIKNNIQNRIHKSIQNNIQNRTNKIALNNNNLINLKNLNLIQIPLMIINNKKKTQMSRHPLKILKKIQCKLRVKKEREKVTIKKRI